MTMHSTRTTTAFVVRATSSAAMKRFTCSSSPRQSNGTSSRIRLWQHPSKRRQRISFLTDIEGDRAYLDRYVHNSHILTFRTITPRDHCIHHQHYLYNFPYTQLIDFTTTTTTTTEQPPHPAEHTENEVENILVCGGDVGDQGGSDLYVLRQLLSLYYRYPNQVHLILGNRDINKMRIPHEMNTQSLREHRSVYWLNHNKMSNTIKRHPPPPPQSPVPRLQWMLQETMGSPRAFQYRKMELQSEPFLATVTDEDVVQSYVDYTRPHGEMTQYLSVAKLVLQIGDAVFMHGALPFTDTPVVPSSSSVLTGTTSVWDDLTFAMPWLKDSFSLSSSSSQPQCAADVGVETISDWMEHLNEFAQQHVKLWKEITSTFHVDEPFAKDIGYWAEYGGYRTDPHDPHFYGNLLQYGMGWTPDRMPNPTVVYNRWGGVQRGSDGTNVRQFLRDSLMAETCEFFHRTNTRILCCGHQPMGQAPNHIRIHSKDNSPGNWILSCDTSYSGDVIWWNDQRQNLGRGDSLSGRGSVAVSEVLLEQVQGRTVDAFCHGILCDGSPYRSMSLQDMDGTSTVGHHPSLQVGMVAHPDSYSQLDPSRAPHKGNWWTQAALDNGKYLLAAGSGFQFWNWEIDA